MLGFLLEVDETAQEARLKAVEASPMALTDRGQVIVALRSRGITYGVDAAVINEAFDALGSQQGPGAVYVIAKGRPVEHGLAGKVDFKVELGGILHANIPKEDDDGRIDFRDAVTITSIQPGELLAELIPPTLGKPGVDLRGRVIPARPGTEANLSAGDGVIVNGMAFLSTASGRAVYEDGMLRVSPILEISKDVGFRTGHVQFDGHVVVRGNVNDDFRVEANSLEVFGTIGASEIKLTGDLKVRTGVTGRGKAVLRVGGNASLVYASECDLTVIGDLTVTRELSSCRTRSLGRVTVGTLVGGECSALLGIIVNELGSELGVSTTAEPGIHFEIRELEKKLESLDLELEALITPIEPLLVDRGRFRALAEPLRDEIRGAFERFSDLSKRHAELAAKLRLAQAGLNDEPVPELLVRQQCYADTLVRTPRCVLRHRLPERGPFLLVEDVEDGILRHAARVSGRLLRAPERGTRGKSKPKRRTP